MELAQLVLRAKDWLSESCTGDFTDAQIQKELTIPNPELRAQVVADLIRMDLIEPVSGRHGVYARVNRECEDISWRDAQNEWFPLRIPLGLDRLARIERGNIIVVAGEGNAGKTLFGLTFAHDNLKQNGGAHDRVYYFNSEMVDSELRKRLLSLDGPANVWDGLYTKRRNHDFHTVIQPDGVNIIDFLEISEKFYAVGEMIKKIHERLTTGVCLIIIQKGKGREYGRGGEFTVEKARLSVSLFNLFGTYMAKIVKCKFPVNEDLNPEGQEMDYNIIRGAQISVKENWRWVTEKDRKALTSQYERDRSAKSFQSTWMDSLEESE